MNLGQKNVVTNKVTILEWMPIQLGSTALLQLEVFFIVFKS